VRARIARFIGGRGSLQRRYALASALFAVLLIAIIFGFGHLLSQSLSRRYLEDLLISGRDEAQRVADSLGHDVGGDLEVVEKRREELYRTLEGLAKRRILESIEVLNPDGEVVFRSEFTSTERVPDEIVAQLELSGALSDQDVYETERSYEIAAPLGDVGEVVLTISKSRIAERVVHLREDLLRQTATVAAATLVTLVTAFMFMWSLIQRNRRLEAQRRQADELAALGSLAANLAHEIRNPLNSINLNLELLEEDLAALEAQESLQSTRQEVGRLARLVSDFLTYARPAQPTKATVRVATLLTDVVSFLRSQAQKAGTHLRLEPDLPEIVLRADAGQLRQVLLNLVLNAVQSVSGLEAGRRVVELSAAETEDCVRLVVRDRGNGMSAEEIPSARKAFYTQRRGGTGLGLAIADRIVEAHDGRLELRNLEPTGFEAAVVLPLSMRDVKIVEAAAEPADGSGRLAPLPGSG